MRDGSSQSPIAGVNVTIQGTTLAASSDASGLYILKNVPAGKYSLQFTLDGYDDKSIESVEIRPNRPTSQSVELAPNSAKAMTPKKQNKGNIGTKPNDNAVPPHAMTPEEKLIAEEKLQQRLDSVREADKTAGIVTGKVTLRDTHGAASQGYVGIEELKSGTKIDKQGDYVLHAPPGSYTIVFGCNEAYETKRIASVKVRLGETTTLDVVLSPAR